MQVYCLTYIAKEFHEYWRFEFDQKIDLNTDFIKVYLSHINEDVGFN